MYSYGEIKKGVRIIYNNEPYEVIDSTIAKKSRQKGANQTKLKNMRTGSVIAVAFHPSDNVKRAELEKDVAIFIYKRDDSFFFHSVDDKSDRFEIQKERIQGSEFIASDSKVDVLKIDDEIISVMPTIKVDLKVIEAPPAVRGNTAQGGNKKVVLETGVSLNVPLFIQEGDFVKVNTQTGEYVERAKINSKNN